MGHPSLALGFVLLAGCFYNPGTFARDDQPFPGTRVRLACLDVAVTLTGDASAQTPVLAYSFGNRCSSSTIVDLASVRVIGRLGDGSRIAMHAYDPKHELRALPI